MPASLNGNLDISNTRRNGMLILSRKKNEIIKLGDDIDIVVVEIRGDKVRLGINAPQDMPVHRQEIYDAIKREGRRRGEG